jgi:large subunit ribosomal protein L6
MSRIGLKPITLPDKVSIDVGGAALTVKGPGGTLTTPLPRGIRCTVASGEVKFERSDDSGPMRAKHGMARALAANAVAGVVKPFEKRLEIIGVGFRAQLQGTKVQLSLGFSHPVNFNVPPGVTIAVEDQTKIVVKGSDRQAVGQVAAQIRALRPPDAYKGKGVRYSGETVRLKAGKTAGK